MSELNQNKSFNYSSFSEFCFHKDELPPETRHTVEVFLEVAGTDDILEAERVLLNKTELDLNYYGISDLSPLATLKNLTDLYLRENEIVDLTPLQALTNLTDIDLSRNQISDISSLQKLVNLIYLNLSENHILNIKALSKLVYLEDLDLSDNQISDINALESLINLRRLCLYSNQVSDLSSFSNLKKIASLILDWNKISEFSSLKHFTNFNKLSVAYNRVKNFKYLQYIPASLIEKYIRLSSIPINRQKATEIIKFAYSSIGLNSPKVVFGNNYQSSFNEIIISLGLNDVRTRNKKKPFPLSMKNGEVNKIRILIQQQTIDYLYKINPTIKIELLEQLVSATFHNSIFMKQALPPLWQRVHSIASNLFRQSNLLQEYLPELYLPDLITPGYILHQICLIETYQSLLKIPLDEKTQQWYDCLNQLFENCGWFIPFEDVCIVCDRPNKFSLDSETRLHAEGEPAIQFTDGYGLYYYHGVALPEQYGKVHPNQWEAKWLLSENNSELRRILIQAIGYNRICDELKAIKIDSFREYDLIKIDAEADVEPIVLLKMICPSTGYTHVLRVPPHMESAREAITWINWGVDPENFAVES